MVLLPGGKIMILELSEREKILLLGLLEDLSQEDDIMDVFTYEERLSIKSIIIKLGGSYFGKL